MANKKTMAENIRKDRLMKYEKACRKLNVFNGGGLLLSVLALLLFFVDWAQIFNTGIPGTEVSFSGFNVLIASVSGYTKTGKAYGDVAIPFYYYAEKYIERLGALTWLALILLIAIVSLQIIALATKKPVMNYITTVIGLLLFVVLTIAFVVALGMNDSQILPIYCSGNPACSIRSYAIIPAIAALLICINHAYATYKYREAKKILGND